MTNIFIISLCGESLLFSKASLTINNVFNNFSHIAKLLDMRIFRNLEISLFWYLYSCRKTKGVVWMLIVHVSKFKGGVWTDFDTVAFDFEHWVAWDNVEISVCIHYVQQTDFRFTCTPSLTPIQIAWFPCDVLGFLQPVRSSQQSS